MNRALIAHLDAMDARWTTRFDRVEQRLDTLVDAIADLRVDLAAHMATHEHGQDDES